MLPTAIKQNIEKQFYDSCNKHLIITGSQYVSGGCINNAAKLVTNEGHFFVKWNDTRKYPGMFESEMKGLALLYESQCISVPKPLFTGNAEGDSFLLMAFVEGSRQKIDFWEDFGVALASLHKNANAQFGLNHDNYIGSLLQSNTSCNFWTDFFINQRLDKQLALAFDSKMLNKAVLKNFENLYRRLPDIFPEEPPALLHGDLWRGNYIPGEKGEACIIDPAVYYGHREMDLAMSKLFGGFSSAFYQGYHNSFPLENDWQNRVEICNLYPLLVHLNLFGEGYLSSIQTVIRRF